MAGQLAQVAQMRAGEARRSGHLAGWRMSFALRAATVADIDRLMGMWQEAAKNTTAAPVARR